MDNQSLAYSKWNFKYHIVFAPKYCRKIKLDIEKALRKLCEHKGVEILEVNECPDRIHNNIT
jgi:putative transposase